MTYAMRLGVGKIFRGKNYAKVKDFFNFAHAELTRSADEVDYFLRDRNTSIEMLSRYPITNITIIVC